MAKNLLIVEDDSFVAELYSHQFTKHGFNTQVAGDGEAALSAASEKRFDGVLLDIMIPKIDGIGVLKGLKGSGQNKDTPVVILSNLGQDELIRQALQLGARAYIIKSLYTPDQVVGEVRSVLGL